MLCNGGMGMTDELSVGHYFERLTMIDMTFGNVDSQLKRFSAPLRLRRATCSSGRLRSRGP